MKTPALIWEHRDHMTQGPILCDMPQLLCMFGLVPSENVKASKEIHVERICPIRLQHAKARIKSSPKSKKWNVGK